MARDPAAKRLIGRPPGKHQAGTEINHTFWLIAIKIIINSVPLENVLENIKFETERIICYT
ncbi:hypothetical protein B1B04_19875 [Lysinibacillus sp. KCTC 33748]|nr:hypothetical protein B1B04_19875 [Lysinibacillus sp. KCTC 33748]